jgi:hypothetical protein
MRTRNNKRDHTIAHNIMRRIQSGEIAMRPRWQFTLFTILNFVGLIATAIVTIYLVNLVVFKLRLASSDRPMYGMQASLDYFASNFPWLAFVFGIVSLGLLLWLARKHDFSYRLGRWLLLAVVLLSIGVGAALAFTSFNNRLENFGPTRGIYNGQKSHGQNGSDGSPEQSGDSTMQRRGQQN